MGVTVVGAKERLVGADNMADLPSARPGVSRFVGFGQSAPARYRVICPLASRARRGRLPRGRQTSSARCWGAREQATGGAARRGWRA